ncbi:MAG: STAS domain-containing protein [Bdellovibrionota bacterium]
MMKTQIKVQDDCTHIELSGYIDFEAMRPLAQNIEQIYKQNSGARVVINLRGLSFVGSSGISSFVKTLKVFNRLSVKPSYCGLKSEFQRMFRLFEDTDVFDICENEDVARQTTRMRFADWQVKASDTGALD